MKTNYLVIIGIIIAITISGIFISLAYNQEIKLIMGMQTDDAPSVDKLELSDPICFVTDRTRSDNIGSGVTMDACFTLKQFEEMGCTKPILEHLYKYSNLLDEESDGTWYMESIGLPEGISQEKFDDCFDAVLEKRPILNIQYDDVEENMADQLRGVFGSCACQERTKSNPDTMERCTQPDISWKNSTHYIDNNSCRWVSLEKYTDENNELNFTLRYDKNGIIIDDLQRIYDWCDYLGEKPDWYFDWNNQTHHIDSKNCEWIKTENDIIEHMKNAVFDKGIGHYDYLPINDNPNMMAMEKIEFQDDNSIDVEFGQNNYEWSTGYKPIPEFEYHANFKVNDTFMVLCTNIGKDGYADAHPDLSKPYLPGLGIVKYLGPITIETEPILLFWHESASIQVEMLCSYPEMIYNSINLWQLEEHGLPTDSLENALGSNYQN